MIAPAAIRRALPQSQLDALIQLKQLRSQFIKLQNFTKLT